jgi:2-polyprenyl-3-methyl-5-hydroxy-6-metoxy-1,4-benzoquinol methylase
MKEEEVIYMEDDVVGESTLEVIAEADRFNRWMYQTILPFCRGKIFEIGSGTGNISRCFVEDNHSIMLSDIREHYCSNLATRFGDSPSVLGIENIDLTDPEFDTKFSGHIGEYNTVFALNVIEHISDDVLALNNCCKLLSEGGQLIILVPSYQKLYNQFDRELGHYRRYTKSSLTQAFTQTPLRIIHRQYFNFTGLFGWFITGSLLRKSAIPGGQMKIYNTLLPVIRIIDKLVLNRAGLSTIIVGRKED